MWRRLTEPDLSTDPLTVEFVRDHHLHVTNGTAEDTYIEKLIRASWRAAERGTGRVLLESDWLRIAAAPPSDSCLELEKSTVQDIVWIKYADADGTFQTFGGSSPQPYTLLNPTLTSNERAYVELAYGESWPSPRSQPDAFQMRVTLGFPLSSDSPAYAAIPEDITHGRLLVIGELYKQRSESVHSVFNTPAVIRARDLWQHWKVY